MSFAKDNRREKTLNSIKLKESQDSRLTSRHIATLMKLDDITLENEKLKTRVDLLEKEFGSCLELHEFARSSKEKFVELKDEYENRIKLLSKEQSQALSQQKEKHTIELKQMTLDYNSEKENFLKQLEEAKDKIDKLQSDKQSVLSDYESVLLTNSELLETANNKDAFNALENKSQAMENELSAVRKENNALKNELDDLKCEITSLKSDLCLSKLQTNTTVVMPADKNSSPQELEQMSAQLDSVMNDSKKYNEELHDLRLKEMKRDELFEDLNKRIELYEMERKVLIQTSNDRAVEIVHLKETLKSLQSLQAKARSLPNSPQQKHAFKMTKSGSNETILKHRDRISVRSATVRSDRTFANTSKKTIASYKK